MYVSVSAYLYVCTCVYTYYIYIYELLTLTRVYVSVSDLYMCVCVCVCLCACVSIRLCENDEGTDTTVSYLLSFIAHCLLLAPQLFHRHRRRHRRHHHRRWWRAVAVRGVVPSPFPIYLVHSSPHRGKCYRRILSHI